MFANCDPFDHPTSSLDALPLLVSKCLAGRSSFSQRVTGQSSGYEKWRQFVMLRNSYGVKFGLNDSFLGARFLDNERLKGPHADKRIKSFCPSSSFVERLLPSAAERTSRCLMDFHGSRK